MDDGLTSTDDARGPTSQCYDAEDDVSCLSPIHGDPMMYNSVEDLTVSIKEVERSMKCEYERRLAARAYYENEAIDPRTPAARRHIGPRLKTGMNSNKENIILSRHDGDTSAMSAVWSYSDDVGDQFEMYYNQGDSAMKTDQGESVYLQGVPQVSHQDESVQGVPQWPHRTT